ncbi:MAG: MFS transporter [Steroidobacteraceae bacterium]
MAESLGAASPAQGPKPSFAALRNPSFRVFVFGSAAAMMADNVEHVISYWVTFRKFSSPALGGFAVISHWLPFLLFSINAGRLADRFDPRRIIQLGMLLFMAVSIAWGLLFLKDTLQIWHAIVLLTLHGVAGVLWTPASMLLLHDVVSTEQLQSAVRLNATGRYLGMLLGPAIGSGLLLWLGPAYGLFANVLIYLPLTLWLWKAPYGPRFRTERPASAPPNRGLADVLATLRAVRDNPTIVFMTLLAGGASFFVGNSYQAQMPGFAAALGHGDPGITYGMLLAADAAGALTAGIALESRGLLRARVRTAVILAMLWCTALGAFALTSNYTLALALLFIAGFMELSFSSMAQTLVQVNAPAPLRGRVIGVYSMASLGLRMFSGMTVGMLGAVIGIHWSLALSAIALLTLTSIVATSVSSRRSAPG